MKISKTGYKKNSKDKNQPSLLIPSNRITMKDVEFPVLGVDNYGNQQMMYPGLDYSFPGDYVHETPMKGWLNKYENGGPRIDKLPIQQVDGKVEIAYDGTTVYIRKIGDEKFTSLSPDKSKAFLQKYQGFIPPTLTQVEEQKKKQQAYNAKIAKEKKEFDELRKIDTTPNPREKQMMIELAKKQRAELSEKGFLEKAWDALPDASSITDPIARAYHALPDVEDVTKGVSTLLNLPEDIAKAGATYLWNSYKIPETEIPGLRQFGELTPREIYESFQNRYVEKNFGDAGLIGESNLEGFDILDETSGTSDMQELPKSRAKYGPQRLPARKDSRGNLLPDYQPIGGNDSLARFTYTFNNDIAGADSLPPTHFVTPKIKELTGNPARPRKWDNAFAVGDFLRDADITENQFYHPDKYYVGTSNSALRNSDLGIKSNKLISASNQLLNDPEKYWAVYKWDPKNPEAAWVRYMKTNEIKSKKDELEKQGWSLDMPVSGQHRFDDVDWEGKGSDTGYKADSEWVPLKKGAKQIKSQKGVNHTYIPQGTRKGQDKGTYNLFSGGSITFIWKDPETNERLASTLAGSVSDMKAYGEKLKKEYGLKEGDLEIIYHDTGSYSAKPAAKDGTLYYDQWKNYNAYNKGYSGAALIVPTEDWLENWTPNKKEGGQLDQYQKRGEVHQKVYTDPKEFAKANKAYNDSLDLYTRSYNLLKDLVPTSAYTSNIPYDKVHWTADGPGGYFIDDADFGRQFLGELYGKDTNFRIPGTKEQIILEEAFSKRIKPIGFNTVDFAAPIYKFPTEEPVYEELKNMTPLDARFELPKPKLDIGKPVVKSQGIRIKPMMTADQATSTGQYQSGKYMWDPNTKSWKVQMFSPETQRENKEDVKLKSKKNGGWLDQYQGTDQSSQVKTYASDPNYFNSHAVLVDNSQANELVKSKIYAGTHGWDPSTNSLVRLDKPVAVPEAVREMSTADYGKKSYKERFESNTPAGKEVRKAAVAQGMKDMVQNPLLYAPGAIAAGVVAAPAIAGAVPAISGALSAPFTYGATTLPGVTAASILDAAGATLATQQLLDPTSMTRQSVSRASENPTAGNVLAALGEVGLTGLDYLGLGIGSEVFQGARRAGNKFLNTNLGQALTPFSQRNIQDELTGASDRIKYIYSEDMPFYTDLSYDINRGIYTRESNNAFRNYLARKPLTAGSGDNSLEAIMNRVKTLDKSQKIKTAENFRLDNGDLIAGNKGAFFKQPSTSTDSPVLTSGSTSIIDLKSGKPVTAEVVPTSVSSRIKLETGPDGKKLVNVLDESKNTPEVSGDYIKTLQNNIQHIEDTVPGAKVFGSSRGVAEGNLPHLSSDYDILISESDYLKNVKNKYPEKGVVGSAHKHDISGKPDNNTEDYVLDFNIIHENPDGTVRPVWIKTGMGVESSREVELFRQAFPEEFYEASRQSILNGTPIKINKTPKELIEKLDPTVKSIMDSYESTKSKHINRIDAYINYGDPSKVSTAQSSFVKSLVGPKGSVGHQFDPSAFADVNNNKAILDQIGFVGDKTVVAKDPKRMQLALNDYYINSTVLTRNVSTGKDQLGHISNIDKAFKNWNYANPSGTAAGTGLNHVKLGMPFDGTNFDNLAIGNKQVGLNLDTSNVNNYIQSIKRQTDGSYVLDKDELDTVKDLMNKAFGEGFSNKFENTLAGVQGEQIKVPTYDLINLHHKGFLNDVVNVNDYTKYHDFNKSLEEKLGIRTVSGIDYGNSEFSATLGDFNDKLDALGFGLKENMPQLKSAKARQNNFNFKLKNDTNLNSVEKLVNSDNFKQIEGYVKGGISKAQERLKMLAEEKQMLLAQSEKIRRNYSKDLYSELDYVTSKLKSLENEAETLSAKRDQLRDTSRKISDLRKQLVVGTGAVGFAGALGYAVASNDDSSKVDESFGVSGDKTFEENVSSFYDNYLQHLYGAVGMDTTTVPLNDPRRIPKKKHGGWLDKYQNGSQVKTYESDPAYFDNRAVFVDNPQANDLVRSKVYSGTHGWDPTTNSLVKLDKPVAVPKSVQEMSTADWGKKSSKERFESNTPAGKATRKAVVARDMKQMVQNPAFYAPGAIAAGALAVPALAGALTAPLTVGSTVVPGATIGNAISAGFATDALVNRLPQIPGQLSRGEYTDAAVNAGTALLDVGTAGMLTPLYNTVAKTARSISTPKYLPDMADDVDDMSFFDPFETANINRQVKEGNTWLQNWFSDPATAKRIADTGFDESSLVKKNIEDFKANKNVVRYEPSLDVWTGNELGSYFPKKNKAYVDAAHYSFLDGSKSIPSTVIHEGTHLTSAGELAYNQKLTDLTTDIFKGSDVSEFAKMFRSKDDIKQLNKLTSPAETHARIMQIRQQYNIKPEQIVDDTVINKIIEDGLSGKLPVSKKFFELIKNKDAFKKAMNTLPAIGTGIAIGAGGLQEKKTGGWLDKYQDGGSREMPFGLPLREQNIYLLPEYNQPMANGYILPDPNRPQLLNTGATEYKYSYGMDDREVQVPSVVAGQYIGDKAFDRYMISGEEFKPMADPSSYSKYYDMLMELGLMQKKKGGEPYPSLGYYEYIGGYRGASA